MITDINEVGDGATLEGDLCVVGAGAAGITLAMELRHSGLKVILLESGGLEPDDDTQELYDGDAGDSDYPLMSSRLRYFGGTTNHWGGWCAPLQEVDFEAREGVPHGGWPIKLADLEEGYRKAQTYCELGAYTYLDPAYWMGQRKGSVLDLNGTNLRNQFFQVSRPTHFGDEYRDELVASPDVTVFLNANVTAMRAEGGAVADLEVRTLAGKTHTVKARRYVLACGGMENARLLLLNGLANSSGAVGRFFMEHTGLGDVARVQLSHRAGALLSLYEPYHPTYDVRELGLFATVCFKPDVLRQHGLINMDFRLIHEAASDPGREAIANIIRAAKQGRPPGSLGVHMGNLLEHPESIPNTLYQMLTGKDRYLIGQKPPAMMLNMMVEQSPNPDSTVSLSDERDALGQRRIKLDWRYNDRDARDVDRGLRLLGAELRRTRLGALQILKNLEEDWADSVGLNWHHMGTTRMSADPRLGVVDAQCRTHDLENLYVAGSSVFPSAGFVNPTLTIVALAARLAAHLRATV